MTPPDQDVDPGTPPGEPADRALSRLLRWYPRAWRERYGEEFLAMVEDTLDGRRAGWRLHLSVAWAGLRERGRRTAPAALRKFATSDEKVPSVGPMRMPITVGALFLAVWNSIRLSAGAHHQTSWAVEAGAVAGLGVVIGLSMTATGLVAGPALVRFLRAGGWPRIRRQAAAWATVVTLMAAGTLTRLLLMLNSMTYGQLKTSGTVFFWFIATILLLEVSLLLWRRAGRAIAQRLDLRPGIRATQLMLNAVAANASFVVTPVLGTWIGQTEHFGPLLVIGLFALILRGRAVPFRLWQAWLAGRQLRADAAGGRWA
jgi:hypothetical protein